MSKTRKGYRIDVLCGKVPEDTIKYVRELEDRNEVERIHVKVLQEDKVTFLKELYKTRLEVIKLRKVIDDLKAKEGKST